MNDRAPWARDDSFFGGNVVEGRTVDVVLFIPHSTGQG
jgi:hypothetical protein